MQMQTITPEAREALVASRIEVAVGLDLVDKAGKVLADLTEHLDPEGSSVGRNSNDAIHGACTLRLLKRLDWGLARVRPWMSIGGHRANLGVYVLSTPTAISGETPQTWSVEGFDLLEVLASPYGKTFRAAAGANILSTVADLLTSVGETRHLLGTFSDSPALTADFVRPIEAKNTTLSIINELLGLGGYAPIFTDWEGRYRAVPLSEVRYHGDAYVLDTSDPRTTVAPDATLAEDLFGVPNVLVALWDDPDLGLPVLDNGIHVERNDYDGPTSVKARGREITEIAKFEVTSHAVLVARAQAAMQDYRRRNRVWTGRTAPNPFHWHRTSARIIDADLGLDLGMISRSWTLPLDGSDMTHTFEEA